MHNAKVLNTTIHTAKQVSYRIGESDSDSKELLGGLEKFTVVLVSHIAINHLHACQQVKEHRCCDNWGQTELHQGTLIRGQDSAELIQGVSRVQLLHSVE